MCEFERVILLVKIAIKRVMSYPSLPILAASLNADCTLESPGEL